MPCSSCWVPPALKHYANSLVYSTGGQAGKYRPPFEGSVELTLIRQERGLKWESFYWRPQEEDPVLGEPPDINLCPSIVGKMVPAVGVVPDRVVARIRLSISYSLFFTGEWKHNAHQTPRQYFPRHCFRRTRAWHQRQQRRRQQQPDLLPACGARGVEAGLPLPEGKPAGVRSHDRAVSATVSRRKGVEAAG